MSKFLHWRIHRRRHDKPCNLSHCIEMHNTHPLSRAGQLSQTYFTHSAPILAPGNQPPTVNKQWPPLRESRMSRHTRFNPAEKRKLPRCTIYFLLQIQFTGRYDHWPESDFVFLLCRKCQNLSYLKYNSQICHREAHATLVKPAAPARRHFCFLSSRDVTWFGWFQHRIRRVLPYATCDLAVLLHNY